jgi:hypothetical protein
MIDMRTSLDPQLSAKSQCCAKFRKETTPEIDAFDHALHQEGQRTGQTRVAPPPSTCDAAVDVDADIREAAVESARPS